VLPIKIKIVGDKIAGLGRVHPCPAISHVLMIQAEIKLQDLHISVRPYTQHTIIKPEKKLIKFNKVVALPIYLYGCETWVDKLLQIAETKFLRTEALFKLSVR
jgi:hypothetical protein